MSEWKTYRLGDICTFVAGFAFKSKDFGNYPDKVIKIADIQPPIVDMSSLTGIDISQYSSQKLEKYKTEKGDYVLAMTGATIGKLGRIVSEKKAYINQRVLLFKPIDKYIDKNYLYYYLCQNTFFSHIRNHIDSETAQPNISANSIGEFTLTLPSLDEQRRIAGILGSLDDKIELNQRINANLEAQAQALFRSWFVDFEPFRNGPFVDSELGKIPQGWKVGNLSEVADITMGQSPKGSSYNEEGDGIIFYQGRAEFGNRFPSIRLYTTEPTRIAEINSVLLSVRAPVGDINIAKNKCCIGRGLAAIKSKQGYNSFILYLLQSLKPLLEQYNGEGTVFGCINRKEIEGLPIIIPKESVINEFERIAENIDSEIKSLTTEQETLSALRDTLLPKLMAGEYL